MTSAAFILLALLQGDSVRVADRIHCRNCTLVIEAGPVLASVPERVKLSAGSRFSSTPSGGFIAAETGDATTLVEYDSKGQFVREIRLLADTAHPLRGMPQAIAVGGDGTIHLAGASFRRSSGESSTVFVRARLFDDPMPQVHAILAMNPRASIVQAMVPARSGGKAFHLIGAAGEVKRSFGEGTNVTFLEGFGATRRRLARESAVAFWAVPPNDYRLTLWDTLGVLRTKLRVESRWFQAWDERRSLGDLRSTRWPPVIQGIERDARGFLWVLGWIPRAGWDPPPDSREKALSREPFLTREDYERAFQSVVEIIDPRCGIIVHREVVERVLAGFVPGSDGEPVSVSPDYDARRRTSTFSVVRLALRSNGQRLEAGTLCWRGPR